MTLKPFLAISLALVMLLGTTTLGFAEPLRVQLEKGLEIDQLQCSNPEHVLVLRTNGNLACLTEKTADRMEWEIIQNNPPILDAKTSVDNYNMEFLHNLETINTVEANGVGAPSVYSPGTSLDEISHIPKLGDIFEVTVTAERDPPSSSDIHIITSVVTAEHFEYIEDSFPEHTKFRTSTTPGSPNIEYATVKFLDTETANLTFQVRAISEGYGYVSAGASYYNTSDGFQIYVDQNNSFYYEDEDKPTSNLIDSPRYGIDYADMVKLQEQSTQSISVTASDGSNDVQELPYVDEQTVKEFALTNIDWADYADNKSYYQDMPKAQNVNATIYIPSKIPLNQVETIKVKLESIERENNYEHALIELKIGPGLKLDAQSLDCPLCKVYDVYYNDIFLIGPNNETIIDYPIEGKKAGNWMLNFVINDKYIRHTVTVE